METPYTSNVSSSVLNDFLSLAGQGPPGEGEVHFTGADPVFPTSIRMAEPGAAAIAASALMASRIYEARTGQKQSLSVDMEAAGAAMRSWRYFQKAPGGKPRTPTPNSSTFYRTRDDRWIFLHQRAAHHLQRQREVLGCGVDTHLEAAIGRWHAEELEAAILEAGACAAMVRTRKEWTDHQQGAAVQRMPLFTLTQTSESPVKPAGHGPRPLAGVRVLDLTRVLAGPTTTRALAEHGADVLRICSPVHPDDQHMQADTGHGKRSTVLDLRLNRDSAKLRELVRESDVFVQGYRPGGLSGLGFSPEELKELRSDIITVSISAFGTLGPWRKYRGFDSVVQAASGVVEETSGESLPHSLPANPLDYTTGYLGAYLIQVALQRRAQEGGSYHIELSLAQTGNYLDGLPRLHPSQVNPVPPELPQRRLSELMLEHWTPSGRLSFLAPVAQLQRTPAYWDRHTVPEDYHSPEWS